MKLIKQTPPYSQQRGDLDKLDFKKVRRWRNVMHVVTLSTSNGAVGHDEFMCLLKEKDLGAAEAFTSAPNLNSSV